MNRYKLYIRLLNGSTILHELHFDFDPASPWTYEALVPSLFQQPPAWGRVQVELKAVPDEPL